MNQKMKSDMSIDTVFLYFEVSQNDLVSVGKAALQYSLATAINYLNAIDIFKSLLTSAEKTVVGGENVGMIRALADFADAAYNLQHPEATEYVNINDVGTYANASYSAVIKEKWVPLQFGSLAPVLDSGAVKTGMLSDGFYINGNAGACVMRCGDALVLSFRGTNDNGTNPTDPNNIIHPDVDQWVNMVNHYALLNPLIQAVDSYVATNGISKVYVTGHSMGGAMALEYMYGHSGSKYQAVTFAASPFTKQNWLGVPLRVDYPTDNRITQIEVLKDPVPVPFDLNLWFDGGQNPRPGHVISFGGDKTLDAPDWNPLPHSWATGISGYYARNANHSVEYYRQLTKSVDADSWAKILAGTGTQTVLLGGRQQGQDFVVDGQLSGKNTSVDNGNDQLKSIDFKSLDFKVIYGGKGNDILMAGANATELLGGIGNDQLTGGAGNDALYGGAGNDVLSGGNGNDTLVGGAGSDVYIIDALGDVIIEASGEGTDTVKASISITLANNVENLTLTGTSSINGTGNALNNHLLGNAASNILFCDSGNDVLIGGRGNDTLTGGTGQDIFRFNAALNANIDRITDFNVADDTIQLENAVFSKLITTGILNAANFKIGTAATDANDFIVYNKNTGGLFYDTDGNGSVAAIQIAILGANIALTHNDFVVI